MNEIKITQRFTNVQVATPANSQGATYYWAAVRMESREVRRYHVWSWAGVDFTANEVACFVRETAAWAGQPVLVQLENRETGAVSTRSVKAEKGDW